MSALNVNPVLFAIQRNIAAGKIHTRTCGVCQKRALQRDINLFWVEVICCRAEHRLGDAAGSLGLCSQCMKSYIPKVIGGQEQCRTEGCSRSLVVDMEAAEAYSVRGPVRARIAEPVLVYRLDEGTAK